MRQHNRACPAYGNYQPPYEECNCGAEEMPNLINVDIRIAELDKKIREKYRDVGEPHLSLMVDLYMLIYEHTKKNKTYIDALRLLEVVERNIKKMELK